MKDKTFWKDSARQDRIPEEMGQVNYFGRIYYSKFEVRSDLTLKELRRQRWQCLTSYHNYYRLSSSWHPRWSMHIYFSLRHTGNRKVWVSYMFKILVTCFVGSTAMKGVRIYILCTQLLHRFDLSPQKIEHSSIPNSGKGRWKREGEMDT